MKTEHPLVSIITVTYNAAKVIDATIQSIISQSYHHIEWIVIDGGSTDDTLKKIKQHEGIIGTLVSERDNGIYDAMNKGIKAARGTWLMFLNAGDSFYDNGVLNDFFYEDRNQYLLLYGKVQTINEPTGINYINGSEVGIQDFYRRFPICHQAAFIHADAFKKIGIYDIRYKMVADQHWFARLFVLYPNKTLFVNRIVAYYDVQGASYHKRMVSQRELLQYGIKLFPPYVWVTNYLFYPVVRIKVWLIRKCQQTTWFKKYRIWKFNRNRYQQNLSM
jgi:glycosyltransferase involved in cell wall biosynthesis